LPGVETSEHEDHAGRDAAVIRSEAKVLPSVGDEDLSQSLSAGQSIVLGL